MPCWFCDTRLKRARPRGNGPQTESIEHLVAFANGGDDSPENRRVACQRCNCFVDSWPLRVKVAWRVLVRERPWAELERAYGREGFRDRIRLHLEELEIPKGDPAIDRALSLLPMETGPSADAVPDGEEISVGVAEYLARHGTMPRGKREGGWTFLPEGKGPWSYGEGSTYGQAKRKAVRRARTAGVRELTVQP